MVDPDSDFKCKSCNLPHKRPKNEDIGKKVTCPFCGGKSMERFDWKTKLEKLRQQNK